jgi:hypothetical protein
MANSPQALTQEFGARSTPAAYVPFKTFLSALDALEHGIPRRIDRTIWRSQSGVVQSQIMMALRFFDLLDDEDRPTPALHRLIEAGPEKRQEHIGSLLHHSYHSIIEHDLTKMTPRMLEEAMEAYNVSGDTKRKAVTFFLQAARFAELPMHPLLQSTIRKSPGSRKKRVSRESSTEVGGTPNTGYQSKPQGGETRTIPLKSGGEVSLRYSVDLFALSTEDRNFVFGLVDMLRTYENRSKESSAQKPTAGANK